MTIQQLYRKLCATYTQENLHLITAKIIALYKGKQFPAIGQLARLVDEGADLSNPGKMFTRLMMVYHPDRLNFYRGEMDRHFRENYRVMLERYAHILPALDLQQNLVVLRRPTTDEPSEERYEWEEPESGYDDIDEELLHEFDPEPSGTDFYSALKRNIYGHERVELPYYYLEELEAVELSGAGITEIDGIQYCTNATVVDLSDNEIADITELSALTTLQELFVSNNRIGYIDALSFTVHLRILDLSYNSIEDVTPLLALGHLDYVNIIGNPVPDRQAEMLRRRGAVVIA